MFYLIRDNLGTQTCVHKDTSDNYTNNMNIGCGAALPYPTNVQKVRNIKIRCTGSSGSVNAEVYCDYITATNLNLV